MTVILEAKNLTKSYGGVRVVDDLSVSLVRGRRSGSSAPTARARPPCSTCSPGSIHPDAGRVVFAGDDISHRSPDERCHRRSRAHLPDPQAFRGHDRLRERPGGAARTDARNRRRPRTSCAPERCIAPAILPRANVLAESLSLLERKRLELARALAIEPKVLLLDEIAGGLTEHEVQSLIETIKQLRAEGITIIWIEHIVHALLAVVDRLIAIDFGQLIAEGDPQTVINSPEVQRRLHGEHGPVSLLELDEHLHRLRPLSGPVRCQPAHRRRRDARHHRGQRGGKIHAASHHLRSHPHRQRQGTFRWPADRSTASAQAGRVGDSLRARRALGLPEPHREREPPGGGARAPDRRLDHRQGLRALPAALAAPPAAGLQPLRRGAAGLGHRSRADGESSPAPAR